MRTVSISNEVLLPQVARLRAEGREVTVKAKGNSMMPFIVGGRDRVILRKKDALAIGDIVLAEIAPHLFVLHRIISIEATHIVLMGDGNLQVTEKCPKDAVCGHVIRVIKANRQIDCNSKAERRKASIWKKLHPVRRYLLAIYRRIT